MGLQLFTVRDALAKDPVDTLKKLKKMGYEDFETYGFNPKTKKIYGFKIPEFKEILDDLNLTTTSGHYGFSEYFNSSDDELKWFVDHCISASKKLNAPFITWPWVHPERRNPESFKVLADKLNLIGELVKSAGLGFAYHNHGYEFQNWGGTTGHEILMKITDKNLVKLQMDMYWVIHSGKTPKELVDKHPGRYVMWHIKDMDKITRDYSELGNGSIDYAKILPDAKKSGMKYYYIEQGGNFASTDMESAATSATYFKKNLRHLI
ncbi:MAG: xylose isomerase [Flavobacteriaceae bacterium]|nr:xylose isomerase [Flavobacteriaceae bacterium]